MADIIVAVQAPPNGLLRRPDLTQALAFPFHTMGNDTLPPADSFLRN